MCSSFFYVGTVVISCKTIYGKNGRRDNGQYDCFHYLESPPPFGEINSPDWFAECNAGHQRLQVSLFYSVGFISFE
jgi:hypothetical protein